MRQQAIKLIIRKHTPVPSKFGGFRRTDLIQVGAIEYQDSLSFFKFINPQAPMVWDSQFAYWLYRMFGEGIYTINAWQKGHAGFWIFMKVQCYHDGFMRLQKHESQDKKEKKANVLEYKRLTQSLKTAADADERQQIQEDIESIKEDIDINKLLIEVDNVNKSGCYPFLKSTIPIYRFHSYEEYLGETVRNEVQGGMDLF